MYLDVPMWVGLFCSLYKRMWRVRHYGLTIIVLVSFYCWNNSAHLSTCGNLFDVGLAFSHWKSLAHQRVCFCWYLWISQRLTNSLELFLSAASVVGHMLVFMNNYISSTSGWNWDIWLQASVPVTKQVLAVLVSQLKTVPANRELNLEVLSINWH